ncbi:MAG: HAD family hydrolase [Oligoflexia bacterium]|nr:HAD family hydrolase [Oligoflexia bacterium]
MPVDAITFDLWDTLVVDDSDEADRAAQGLLSKPLARQALFTTELSTHHPDLAKDALSDAWNIGLARFRHAWKVDQHTPSVAWRIDQALRTLGVARTPGFDALVDAIERMELDLPPQPVAGIKDALDALAGRYRLGIISDTIVTPGRHLRGILRQHGLFDYFDAFVFSDEAGASKPSPRVFAQASQQLKTPLFSMAHVGDREANDVAGPLAVGMKAVLFLAVVDRGSQATAATASCARAADLPDTIAAL